MFEKFTEKARRAIFFARYEASRFGSPYIETAHLLLGIIREDAALLKRLLHSPERVESLRAHIEKQCPQEKSISTSVDLPLSKESIRALEHAAREAAQRQQDYISPAHLLLGIHIEEALSPAKILRENGITALGLTAELAPSTSADVEYLPSPNTVSPMEAPAEPPVLRNLSAAAKEGTLGPLIGRERELERIIQILCRRIRNNPVLVGEPGVGKTAIVEGLAKRMADGDVTAYLAERPVFAIDASSLVAPSRRAQSGERPETMLTEIVGHRIGILCVEGLLDLAASPGWGAVEATHVLETLSRSGIQCIATGTPAGLRHAMEKTGALVRHFEVVNIAPPTEDEAVGILTGLQAQFESFHGVVFEAGAIEAAVFASGRFLTHRFLPDRAIDLIDEAGARGKVRLEAVPGEEKEVRKRLRDCARNMENAIARHEFLKAREYADQEREERIKLDQLREQSKLSSTNVVTSSDIEEVVAERAGVPVSVVREVLRQKKGKELKEVIGELAAGISVEPCEWLPFLASYLVGCSAEEAEKLVEAIRAAKRPPGQTTL